MAPVVPAPVIEENEKHKAVISNLTTGQSVLRNIEGLLAHRDLHYHGLKNVQTVFPQESNGFQIGQSILSLSIHYLHFRSYYLKLWYVYLFIEPVRSFLTHYRLASQLASALIYNLSCIFISLVVLPIFH